MLNFLTLDILLKEKIIIWYGEFEIINNYLIKF